MDRLLVTVLAFFGLLGVAQAAVVDSSGEGEFVFTADSGEANRVHVTSTADFGHLVVDDGALLTALGTCTSSTGEHSAQCDYEPSCTDRCYGEDSIVSLGDGRDRVRLDAGSSARVDGGTGRDRIVSDGPVDAYGGSGDDVLLGGEEDGMDQLDGGPGADVLDGRGGDSDVAGYYARAAGVTVTLDGRANDGARDEGDLVKTEWVYGGTGADRLVGNSERNVLSGEAGNDTILGGGARDVVDGRQDDDALYGGGGDDVLLGDVGDDKLHGGGGPDELQGSNGADELWGGPGDDRIISFDQNPDPPDPRFDRIRCGPGEDTVYMGPEDHAGHGCETVLKGTPPR